MAPRLLNGPTVVAGPGAARADGTKVLDLKYNVSPTTTNIPSKMTSPDPKRLLIKSYGFGPQGAEKRLELLVNHANLEFERS